MRKRPRIARGLTPGERDYAEAIFGDDLNYDRVVIHNRRAYLFQPHNTAIAPNGQIYFSARSYKADFSLTLLEAAWLIHELTHVWQHQRRMWVRLRGALNRTYHYGALEGADRPFLAYGIEQQASIVTDYFRLTYGLWTVHGDGTLDDYRRIIPFLPPPLTQG